MTGGLSPPHASGRFLSSHDASPPAQKCDHVTHNAETTLGSAFLHNPGPSILKTWYTASMLLATALRRISGPRIAVVVAPRSCLAYGMYKLKRTMSTGKGRVGLEWSGNMLAATSVLRREGIAHASGSRRGRNMTAR